MIINLLIFSSRCRILRGPCQRICMVHNQLLTGKDCLENGALDTTQRAQQQPHRKWVLLQTKENIQLLPENNTLNNEIKIVTRYETPAGRVHLKLKSWDVQCRFFVIKKKELTRCTLLVGSMWDGLKNE